MELPSFDCVLCSCQTEESQSHLFLDCQFAQGCWNLIGLHIDSDDPFQILENFSAQLNVPCTLDIIIIMTWCIWMARNDMIFKGIVANLNSDRLRFKSEFALVVLRAKDSSQAAMFIWMEHSL